MSKREKFEHAIVARIGNEADVVAQPRDVGDRLSFALVFVDRGERDAPIGGRFRALHRDSVSAEQLDRHAGDGLPGFDRGNKNIAGLIGVLLYEQAEIADQDKAARRGRLDLFFPDRVPAARFQEEKAAFAAAVRRLLQMLGKIERGIVRLPFVLGG